MLESIVNAIASFSRELAVVVVAALPVSELRGAIPIALAMNFPPAKAYMLAFIGNLIPVAPLLFLLQPIANKLRHIRIFKKFFDWLFEMTKRKAALVERFEALGLILFVAIPLPVTGAWTGCIAATLFKIRFRYAFVSILLGVVIAGFIVLGLSLFGKRILS